MASETSPLAILSMDVRLYDAGIQNTQPVKGGSDVQFNIPTLVEHFEDFVWTTTNTVQLINPPSDGTRIPCLEPSKNTSLLHCC